MDGYGGHALIPLETPTEWLARWRVWIVAIGVAVLTWLIWWSDATHSRTCREEQKGDVVELMEAERRVRVEEQRARLEQRTEAAMAKPLTLEEEMVSLHNLRLAVDSGSNDDVRSDAA